MSVKDVSDFPKTVFASRGTCDASRYPLYFDTEKDAITEDEVQIEGQDDEVALVAEYKLVRVRMLRLKTKTTVLQVKE
jgi:hypothetical protein